MFWDVIWLIFTAFLFTAYLIVMFYVLRDIFRDTGASGLARAGWVLALIFLPVLTACIYVATRGNEMRERSVAHRQDMVEQPTTPGGPTLPAPGSPADQIAKAKQLSDAGVISTAEFDALKEKALR